MADQKPFYTCADLRAKWDDYLDQELPPEEAARVLEHLSNCPDCARRAQDYYLALAELREAVQALALPEGMAKRLSRRLKADESCHSEHER